MSEHQVTIKATDGRRDGILRFQIRGQIPEAPSDGEGGGELFERFIEIVNQDHLHVLEIGSPLKLSRSA